MTKKILATIILAVFTGALAKAQVKHSQWTLSSKKINECEYDLIFTVTLDKGWHTFSHLRIEGTNGEIFPTEIKFTSNRDYVLVGDLKETKPTTEYDGTIKKTVLLHYNKVVFTQRVRVNTAGKIIISGRYQNQVCNDDLCESPPYEKFDFTLEGSTSCSK